MGEFKDHFSGFAADYSAFRPQWPSKLFAWLASQAPARELAWDCACGNGQAARALAPYFNQVIATDASSEQIRHATGCENVAYRVELAEKSSLSDHSVDLLLVAQAYHWLDPQAFLHEARRVLKADGMLAICFYQMVHINDRVDQSVIRLWGEVLEGWWPPERALVDNGFAGPPLPWVEIETPSFGIAKDWKLAELRAYLQTWSAVHRFKEHKGVDPLDLIGRELQAAWGDPELELRVCWPISLRLFRPSG